MATLGQLAKFLGAELHGDASVEVSRVAGFEDASPESIVFAAGEAALARALSTRAGAVISDSSAAATKPVLRVRNAKLAFARSAQFLNQQRGAHGSMVPEGHDFSHAAKGENSQVTLAPEAHSRIHPTAVLGSNVVLGKNVHIGASCVIGDGVVLGAFTCLYPRVVIYPGVTLGQRVIVHAGAVLGSDGFGYVRDPESGEYIAFPQQGTLVIEDDVEVGANTTIDRGALGETRIGGGTKIDNLVHIAHNVTIGRNVVIAAQTGISGSSSIGEGAVLGGQVGVGDHANIGDGVILGGGSGVLSNKKISGPGELFWGTPARPIQQYLRELATLARLSRDKPARKRDE